MDALGGENMRNKKKEVRKLLQEVAPMITLRRCYESLHFIYHPMATMLPYKTNFQHGTALECDYIEYAHTHSIPKLNTIVFFIK